MHREISDEEAQVLLDDNCCALALPRVFRDGHIGELEHLLGYVFVIEPARPDPKYKIPGGHRKLGEIPPETPLEAARRELLGESGIVCPPERFTFVNTDWKLGGDGHWSCLYLADVGEDELPWLSSSHIENEGEIPVFLTVEALKAEIKEGTILWPHLRRLREQNLIS